MKMSWFMPYQHVYATLYYLQVIDSKTATIPTLGRSEYLIDRQEPNRDLIRCLIIASPLLYL
jgi:hypothetical protein